MHKTNNQCTIMPCEPVDIRVYQNQILNNLYKEFTCTICLQLFQDPVTVSGCKHTYCQDCLKQWKVKSDQSNSKTFKCPLCKNITTNRAFYPNEKYALTVKFLIVLETYMESLRKTGQLNQNEYRLLSLEKYLNDCVKYQIDDENKGPEIKIDLCYDRNKDAESNCINITDSEENEFILNICSTADNVNIINKLENDFIDNLERETKLYSTTSKINKEDVHTIYTVASSTSTINKENSPATKINKKDSPKTSSWDLLKTVNRDINKKAGKYKRLKVTNKKSKNASAEKKRNSKSPEKEIILGDFDEYLEEKKNTSKNKLSETAPIILEKNVEANMDNGERINENDKETLNDDDVFLRSTQILKLDQLNPEVSIINRDARKSFDNITSKKDTTISNNNNNTQKTPDTNENNSVILVHADVHHSIDSDVNYRIKTVNTHTNIDIIESSAEAVKITRSSKKKPKRQSTKNVALLNLKNEFKEPLKKGTEFDSSVLQSLVKEYENTLAEYSDFVENFDSLLSNDEPCKENTSFYDIAKPYVQKNKGFCEKLKALSDQLMKYSTVSPTINISNKNKVLANIETQTDILKCPTCTFTFNLRSASKDTTPRNESESNSEGFNAFLDDVKNDLCNHQTKDQLPEIPEKFQSKDAKKNRFKRIRAPTDSDSEDLSGSSKKSKNNSFQSKLLVREDIDVYFHSSTSQMYSNINPTNNISSNLETNKTVSMKDTTLPTTNSKSSEDTLLYLEQQYKNPIDLPLNTSLEVNKDVPEKCNTSNTNLENLLSGIDVTAFENDFTITNKNTEIQPESHQSHQKTELSASLFTETQLNKLNASIINREEPNKNNVINAGIIEKDSIVEDSCDSDEIFEDDIVDTTPQKINDYKRINETEMNKNNTSKTNGLTGNSKLELLKLQNPNPSKTNTNTTSMTPDVLPLSNIDLNCGFFDNSKFITASQATQVKESNIDSGKSMNLKPLLLMQNEECSPLQIVKQPNYICTNKPEIPKHQSSILSYVTAQASPRITDPVEMNISNDGNNVERCESPVLHSRPAATAAAVVPVVLCTSRLQSKENADIMSFAPRLNARFTNAFNEYVTHLIVKVDENNCVVDQTIKYALAISRGIWIVSYSWFKRCMNTNRLLLEEPFEVLDMSGVPGPKLSRLQRDNLLFKDFNFYILDPVKSAKRSELEEVIVNLGGEIKRSFPDTRISTGKHFLIITEGKFCDNLEQYEALKDKYGVMVVDIEWLSESVGQYKLTSIRPYALCSDDKIETYGYPLELIAPIPESQNETLYSHLLHC